MTTKKKSAPRTKARASIKASAAVYPVTTFTVAARNLLNMAAVCATSATILLCLMIVKRF